MVTKSIIRNYKKNTNDFIEPDTLIERMRRARALNAKPSDIGITQCVWKTFSVGKKKFTHKHR